MDPVQQDRLAALRQRRDTGRLDAFLRANPLVAEALAGRGPLAACGPFGSRAHGRVRRTLPEVAELVATGACRDLTIAALDRTSAQLLGLAAWRGGRLERDEALALAPGATATQLDEAADRLASTLLSDQDLGWVALRPGVAEHVRLPGVPLRPHTAGVTSEVLGTLLANLGVDAGPRKADRVDALVGALADPAVVAGALDRCGRAERSLFDALCAARGPVRLVDVGIDYFNPRWLTPEARPLQRLLALGLVGVDSGEQLGWVWLDVQVTLRGALYEHWPTEPVAASVPLQGGGVGLPVALGRLEALLDRFGREPAPALKTGLLGVKPVRAAAKELGIEAAAAELLCNLAITLGLLEPVVTGRTGRGRTRTETVAWMPSASLRAQWRAAGPAVQWSHLVHAWREGDHRERESPRWPFGREAAAALVLLHHLRALPEGRGLREEELVGVLAHRHHGLCDPATLAALVTDCRTLGLVPATGPVGLTGPGRSVLAGAAAAATALPAGGRSFVVQADLTVIAPPDLHHEVLRRLGEIAQLESDAGALVFRLAEARLHHAFDQGDDTASVVEFLAAHATAPLPQNVVRFVADAGARHGRLQVHAARCVVTSEDPALLARAVAVKAAKLSLVSPYAAVSSLPESTVFAALRARDLAPAGPAGHGAPTDDAPRERAYFAKRVDGLPPLPEAQVVDDDARAELVDRLGASPKGPR